VERNRAFPSTVTQSAVAKLPYASFWQRLGASLIDGIILLVANFVGGTILGLICAALFGFNSYTDQEAANGLGTIVGIIIPWLYFAGMESSARQATLGKSCAGITVTDENGHRISFGRATGRYFGKFISAITLFVGYLMAAFTPKKQALHDMMAGCLVLRGREQVTHKSFHLTH
jgi:uncharacterized RDD family membrane protein YckC